jgi:putative membrane protein
MGWLFRIAALVALTLIWLPDWPALIGVFPGHMLRHMGLVAVAAPLAVMGWHGLTRFAPPVLLGTVVEAVIVWGAHLPPLHAAARLNGSGFLLEQALFLLAGLAVWGGALRPGAGLVGAGGLLLTSMHMTLLGTILILAPTDLYAALCGVAPDLTGQQLGGMMMLAIGTPIYLAGGLVLTGQSLKERPV